MRRKSTRNAQKATPDKAAKEVETPPKTRRSRRRKRSPSKSSESEEEVLTVTKRAPLEETPDTTTKSHTPSDEETSEEPMWKVTSTEDKGEIQKLKICLTRPSPDSPKKRRSKSNSQTEDETTSSEDKASRRTRSQGSPFVKNDGLSSQEGDEEVEEKKGKGKSKGKHKTKIEKSPHVSEVELQTTNEISENVQVTPQSPSIDKPVDNENDHKVDVADLQNVNERERENENNEESARVIHDSNNQEVSQNKDSDDDEPLSVLQKNVIDHKSTKESEDDTPTVQPVEVETKEPEEETQTELKVRDEQPEPEKPEVVEPVETPAEADEAPTPPVEPLETLPEPAEKEPSPEPETTQEPEEPVSESEPVSKIIEEAPSEPAEEAQVIAKAPPRRRLRRNHEIVQKSEESSSKLRQRKWETTVDLPSSLFKVSLESIQSVWPTIDFPEEPDLDLEVEKERRKSLDSSGGKKLERKVSVEYKSDFSERPPLERQSSVNSGTNDDEEKSNIIAFNRKISIVDDTASKLKPPPSPAKNPTSSILFITNLVRPFTVKQLKELLERTGKVTEEGFWTDRIKSKCYVQYETLEEAEATRNALHGVQWPIGNGKKLIIDYATEEDMNNAKNPPAPPTPTTPVPEIKVAVKENLEPVENKPRAEEKPSKDLEKKRPEGPVREWDIGKKDVRRDRSRSRERNRKHRRSSSPTDDFITRKQRKVEESVPQKLMDDLFLKTKATPSIYWQPLSPEEISMKQQQRLIRMEEHKRRMEENSRMKGRDMGRGAFRRRYD